jgi:hypothetical protein
MMSDWTAQHRAATRGWWCYPFGVGGTWKTHELSATHQVVKNKSIEAIKKFKRQTRLFGACNEELQSSHPTTT